MDQFAIDYRSLSGRNFAIRMKLGKAIGGVLTATCCGGSRGNKEVTAAK